MNCMCGGETDHSPPHRSTERCGGDWSVVTKHPWPMRSTNQTSGHQTSNHQPSSAGLLLFECATRIEGVQPTRSSAGLLPFECSCHCSNRRSPTDDGMWICQFQSWIIRSSGELVCFQVNQLVIRGNATSLSNADLAGTENTSSASPVAHLNKCSFLFPPPPRVYDCTRQNSIFGQRFARHSPTARQVFARRRQPSGAAETSNTKIEPKLRSTNNMHLKHGSKLVKNLNTRPFKLRTRPASILRVEAT